MVSRDEKDLHTLLLERWQHMQKTWKEKHVDKAQPFLTCTYRSPEEQAKLVASGKSRAQPGQSLHNYKPALAFDVAFAKADGSLDWNPATFTLWGELAESLGLEWGGRWAGFFDGPHVQLPMTWQDAKAGKIPRLEPLTKPSEPVPSYKLFSRANEPLGTLEGRVVEGKLYVVSLVVKGQTIL